jgi:epoxyqueuosine reductase
MILSTTDRRWLEDRARAAGFHLAGVASVPGPESELTQLSQQRFSDWIASGHAGEMDWLKRTDAEGRLLRADLRHAMPWARSVLVCALNCNLNDGVDAPLSTDPAEPGSGWIARYAWSGRPARTSDAGEGGSDYHDVLLPPLRAIEADLHARFGPDITSRCYVDTGPIVERDFASRAGVGWIGKNTCVLNQEQGSWLLLGVIVTSLELAPEAQPVPAADRCGSCTRCIDACPTDALIAPREMDASRCISYLTIEKKGSIDEDLRARMGRQVFGCDICQDVCPWNSGAGTAARQRRASPEEREALLPARQALINPPLEWLASLDGPAFNRWFRGSPLERTRRKRVLRNVAIAMGNSGERRFLPQLETWAAGDDPVLAEAARWAAERLRGHTPEPKGLKLAPV